MPKTSLSEKDSNIHLSESSDITGFNGCRLLKEQHNRQDGAPLEMGKKLLGKIADAANMCLYHLAPSCS